MPIEIKNLTYIYSKGSEIETKALNDVSTIFTDHFYYALIGKTGSGKTTLIQHINGLLKPYNGDVIVDDFVLSSDKKKCNKHITNLRKKVGYLFQFSENQLFEETVLKDVMFGPLNFGYTKEEATKLAKEALKKVGIDESFYLRSPFELSGGEKRRVAIAGVIAYNPQYLILDEPTAGLDERGITTVMNLFEDIYKSGTNIILVTHNMDIAYKYCTSAALIENGKVILNDSIQNVFAHDLKQYQIDNCHISMLINSLKKKNLNLNYNDIKDIDTLIAEIKNMKRE